MTNRSNFNLGDYLEVKDRLVLFYERYPEGTLQSEVVELTETRVTIKAWAYRTPDDQRPGVGHSYLNIPGTTPYTRGSEIENAETSAWGRALAAIGIATGKSIASRDEIDSKRHDPEPPQSRQRPPERNLGDSRPRAEESATTDGGSQQMWGILHAAMREAGVTRNPNGYLTAYLSSVGLERAVLQDGVRAWLEANPTLDVRDLAKEVAQHAKETANA